MKNVFWAWKKETQSYFVLKAGICYSAHVSMNQLYIRKNSEYATSLYIPIWNILHLTCLAYLSYKTILLCILILMTLEGHPSYRILFNFSPPLASGDQCNAFDLPHIWKSTPICVFGDLFIFFCT